MKKLNLLTIALFTATFAMNTQAFQTEVGGSIGYQDPDQGSGTTVYGVDGTYYFAPITTSDVPYEEAAFLNRVSNINAKTAFSDRNHLKNTVVSAGIDYYVPSSPYYASAEVNYNRQKFNSDDVKSTNKDTQITAEVGYFPQAVPGLLVSAGIAHDRVESKDHYDGEDYDYKKNQTSPLIHAKYVTVLGGHHMNFEGYSILGSDLKTYDVGTDFYFDPTLSVGASYTYTDVKDNGHDSVFGIRAKKFVTQDFSVEGNVGFGDDSDRSYNVRVGYRF